MGNGVGRIKLAHAKIKIKLDSGRKRSRIQSPSDLAFDECLSYKLDGGRYILPFLEYGGKTLTLLLFIPWCRCDKEYIWHLFGGHCIDGALKS